METLSINSLRQTLLIPFSVEMLNVHRGHLAEIEQPDEHSLAGNGASLRRYFTTMESRSAASFGPAQLQFYVCRRGRPPLRPFSRAA